MSPLSAIRASNTAAFASLNSPVGVFVGGTSGIGRAMAETFSHQTTNATLIVVGRNRAAAEEMFARLKAPEGQGSTLKTEFIECDATSMKNVKNVTDEIVARHPRVNFLILSQGFLSMDGYTPTEDGVDKKLALNYYSRWKFIDGLVPALERGKSGEGQGKVLSVLGPGKGGAIDLDDLGLKKTYSTLNAALAAPTYTDLMMEKFASRHPSLTFVHEYPGFVATPMMKNSNSKLLNILSPIVMPLMSPFTTSPEACAEYMWHGVHSSTESGKAYRRGEKGQDIGMERYFGNDEWREKVWEHSQKAASGGLRDA